MMETSSICIHTFHIVAALYYIFASKFVFIKTYFSFQSFTRQFPNEPQVDLDEDFINFGNDEDENDVFKDADLMDDLLGQWDGGGTGN